MPGPGFFACSLVLAGAVLVLLVRRHRRSTLSYLPYPPGPKGLPLIGNVLDVPSVDPWRTYRDWAKRYGPVVHVRLLGQSIVILNDAKTAFDLLEARSAIYSDRAVPAMTSLMGMSWNAGLMPYGLRWRKHRRAIHQYFNIEVVQSYQPLQLSKARVLLHRLRDNPSDFMRSIHFAIGAGIIELVYGHPVKDVDNKYLVIARNSSTAASEGLLPGAFFVDFLPILRYVPTWFPGAVFKRKAAEWRAVFDQMLYVPFNDVKADLDGGKSNTSIMAQMLAEASYLEGRADEEDMEVARNISAVAYGAGADTTYSTMQTFFLAMVLHPEVQKKAQAELATVVGPSRLPDFADRDSLPYINAIVKECARWIPVVPLGVPHATSADDEYEGYFIPKGAVVMANQWAILHDPEDYPEPELFKPERFLKDGKLDPDVRDPSTIAFGFGRRICPGRHLSDASVFINVASILHVFDMKPAVDEYGTPKLPEARATSGFFSYPYPFECDVKARSASAQGLLNEMQ